MQNPYQATEYEIELAQFWQQPWQQRWVPPTNDGDDDTPSSYSSYSDGGDVTPNIAPFGGCYQDLHLHLQHEGESEEHNETNEEPNETNEEPNETNEEPNETNEEPNETNEEPNDEETSQQSRK
jgi:hypothetical protein